MKLFEVSNGMIGRLNDQQSFFRAIILVKCEFVSRRCGCAYGFFATYRLEHVTLRSIISPERVHLPESFGGATRPRRISLASHAAERLPRSYDASNASLDCFVAALACSAWCGKSVMREEKRFQMYFSRNFWSRLHKIFRKTEFGT